MGLFIVIVFIFMFSLHGRVKRLESIMDSASQKSDNLVAAQISSRVSHPNEMISAGVEASPVLKENGASVHVSEAAVSSRSSSDFDVAQWLAKDWPMKLGGFLILLGISWFVSYAFVNNWISPMGRIALGLVAGLCVFGIGEWRIRKVVSQGEVLIIVGSITMILTMFAARVVYDFFTPTFAMAYMFIVVILVAVSSVIHSRIMLSVSSLLFGGIVPLLIHSPQTSFTGLFLYLLILSLGTLWVIYLKQWRILLLLAWAVVFLYSFPYITGISHVSSDDVSVAILFASLFAILFYAANLVSLVRSKSVESVNLLVTALSGVLLLGWIHTLIEPALRGGVTAFFGIIFSMGAILVFRLTRKTAPVLVYCGKALAFLGVALAYEFSGPILVIAYTFEATLAILGAVFLIDRPYAYRAFSVLMAVPTFLSLGNIFDYLSERREVFTSDFFALVTVMLACILIGIVYRSRMNRYLDQNTAAESDANAGVVFLLMGWLYGLFLLWQSLHIAIDQYDVATGVVLFIYTILGMLFYVRGKQNNIKNQSTLGSALLALVAIRLLLVDVWSMGIGGRVVTFLLIGVLFMSTAFMGKSNKDKIN